MSVGWHLYEFDRSVFDAIFMGEDPQAVTLIKAALADPDEFDLPDLELADEMVENVCQNGFDFDDQDEDELDVLDCLITALFKSDQLATRLHVRPLTRVPLSPELLQAIAPISDSTEAGKVYHAMLDGGRRVGQKDSSWCEYIIWDPIEADGVLQDARKLVESRPASDEMTTHAEAALIEPLESRSSTQVGIVCFGS